MHAMQKFKRCAAAVTSAVMMASAVNFTVLPTTAADANLVYDEESGVTYNTQDDWLHVEGDKIFDMNGNEVWLTGCNW